MTFKNKNVNKFFG